MDGLDLSSFITALTGSIQPTEVLAILGQTVAVGMGFFLMWLGVRKAVKAFQTAVASGRLKL